jgi:hypothetical protein
MKLQFTNGYRPRFDQISRIMQYLLSQEGRKRILREDIIGALGIPDKQIENLTSMMTGFGLINPRISTLTDFGKAVAQNDPYFEKDETLWIIHYIVSSNPDWVVWYRVVNSAIPMQDRLSVEKVSEQYFSDLAIHFSERTISQKLPKEVGAVLATYARTELARLNILEQEKTGTFLRSSPIEISASAFLFCILYFRDKYSPGSSALNTEELCTGENSPGRVLNIPENQVRSMLSNLHDMGLIRLEQFANLDQVRIPDTTTQETVISRIYGGKYAS